MRLLVMAFKLTHVEVGVDWELQIGKYKTISGWSRSGAEALAAVFVSAASSRETAAFTDILQLPPRAQPVGCGSGCEGETCACRVISNGRTA